MRVSATFHLSGTVVSGLIIITRIIVYSLPLCYTFTMVMQSVRENIWLIPDDIIIFFPCWSA